MRGEWRCGGADRLRFRTDASPTQGKKRIIAIGAELKNARAVEPRKSRVPLSTPNGLAALIWATCVPPVTTTTRSIRSLSRRLRCVIEGRALSCSAWVDRQVEGGMLLVGPVKPGSR